MRNNKWDILSLFAYATTGFMAVTAYGSAERGEIFHTILFFLLTVYCYCMAVWAHHKGGDTDA